jgi:hypothetical protein
MSFYVGDTVKAQYKFGDDCYEAEIVADNGDGTYAVLYIDGDEWDSCPAEKLEKIIPAYSDDEEPVELTDHTFGLGQAVEAQWKFGSDWYDAEVENQNSDGTYTLRYIDGDVDEQVSEGKMRRAGDKGSPAQGRERTSTLTMDEPDVVWRLLQASDELQKGAQVKATYDGSLEFYAAFVEAENRDGSYALVYEDGDEAEFVPMSQIKIKVKKAAKAAAAPKEGPQKHQKGDKVDYELYCVDSDTRMNGKYKSATVVRVHERVQKYDIQPDDKSPVLKQVDAKYLNGFVKWRKVLVKTFWKGVEKEDADAVIENVQIFSDPTTYDIRFSTNEVEEGVTRSRIQLHSEPHDSVFMPGDSVMVLLQRQSKEGEVIREVKTDATSRSQRKYVVTMRDADNKELEVTYSQLTMNNDEVVEVQGEERSGTKRSRKKNTLPDPPPAPEFKNLNKAHDGDDLLSDHKSHDWVIVDLIVTVKNKAFLFGLGTKALDSNSKINQIRACLEIVGDQGPKNDDMTLKITQEGNKMLDDTWECTNGINYQRLLKNNKGKEGYGNASGGGRRNSLLSVKNSRTPMYDAAMTGPVTEEEQGNGKETRTHFQIKITELEAATEYTLKIAACNVLVETTGPGEWSREITFTTLDGSTEAMANAGRATANGGPAAGERQFILCVADPTASFQMKSGSTLLDSYDALLAEEELGQVDAKPHAIDKQLENLSLEELVEGKSYAIPASGKKGALAEFYRTPRRLNGPQSQSIHSLASKLKWGLLQAEETAQKKLHEERDLNVLLSKGPRQETVLLEVPANLSTMVDNVYYHNLAYGAEQPKKSVRIVPNPVLRDFENQVEDALSFAVSDCVGGCSKARVKLERRLGHRPIVRLPGNRQIKVHMVVKPIMINTPGESWSDKVVRELKKVLKQQQLQGSFAVDYEKSLKAMETIHNPIESTDEMMQRWDGGAATAKAFVLMLLFMTGGWVLQSPVPIPLPLKVIGVIILCVIGNTLVNGVEKSPEFLKAGKSKTRFALDIVAGITGAVESTLQPLTDERTLAIIAASFLVLTVIGEFKDETALLGVFMAWAASLTVLSGGDIHSTSRSNDDITVPVFSIFATIIGALFLAKAGTNEDSKALYVAVIAAVGLALAAAFQAKKAFAPKRAKKEEERASREEEEQAGKTERAFSQEERVPGASRSSLLSVGRREPGSRRGTKYADDADD